MLFADRPPTCIAVGTNLSSTPYVIGTSNNGSTWSAQIPPPNAVDLTGISCSGAVDCIAVGNNGNMGAGSTIMGTTNGGLSWVAQNPPSGTSRLNAVSCPSTADCFAAGVDSVLTSVNAGYAWSAAIVPAQVSGLNGISCATTSVCTAVGFGIFRSPVAMSTTDGGIDLDTRNRPIRSRRLDRRLMCQRFDLPRCQRLLARPSPSIIVSTDGGTVWSSETFPATVSNFTGISCVDSTHCTAVGSSAGGPGAAILSTTNGGGTWIPQTAPSGTTLDGISCSTDTTCLATGSHVDRHRQRRLAMERPWNTSRFDRP